MDGTLEEGIKPCIHCRLRNEESHVMTSGSPCRYQERRSGDGTIGRTGDL